jgi:hypothetical protein
MPHKLRVAVGVTALLLGFVMTGGTPALAQATPTFVNVKVLSLDAQSRLIKVRLPDGTERTAELDDNVAGFGDIAVGDSVVLSMRGEPSRPRVTGIVKGSATPATTVTTAAVPPTAPGAVVAASSPAEATYVGRLAELAKRADAVDREWSALKTSCKAEDSSAYQGSREWLLLWDNPQAADLSGGFCRDLFNQIVSHGTSISSQMAAADSEARRSLAPEKAQELRRAYSLDGNWGTTPPKLLTP